MTETTHQIEAHITQTRENLGENLRELEHKVTSLTDWRQQFQKKPLAAIGVAFGGGVLLAAMAGRRRNRLAGMSSVAADAAHTDPQPGSGRQASPFPEPWDTIKSALIGVVTARVRHIVGDIVPGFAERFSNARHEQTRSSPDLASSHPLPPM